MFKGLDLSNLQGLLSLASLVMNAIMAWVLWSQRQLIKEVAGSMVAEAVATLRKEQKEGADKHEAKLTNHDRRIQRSEDQITEIRHDISQLPDKADIERLGGKIDNAMQLMGRTEAAVREIQSYCLQEGLKGRS